MSVTINDLELQVNYNSKKATAGIDALIGSLGKLKNAISNTRIAELTSNLANLSKLMDKVNANSFVKSMDKVGNNAEKNASKVNDAVKKIKDSTKALNKGLGGDSPNGKLGEGTNPRKLVDLSAKLKKVEAALNKYTKATHKATAATKKHTNMLGKLAKSFARIMFYRAIRSILSSISNAFKEGAKNVALYSKALNGMDSNNANGVMSELATLGLYLKNSFGAAVIPVLKAAIPLFNALADAIVSVVNAFNMFFNALAGRVTFTKAKKYAVDYADSLDKAGSSAKKLKDNLLGIDELNIINDNNGSGSGGGGNAMDYSQMFEEAEVNLPDWLENLKELFENGDYQGLGKAIADLFANALKSIDWGYIKGKAGDIGKGLAELLNGLIDPTLFHEIGRTIAEALNTGIEFAYNLVTTFDWEKAGLSAAELVNGFVETFDAEKLGRTIYEAIHGALDLATTFFNEVKWDEVGQKIMDFISAIDWNQLVLDLEQLGIAVFNAVGETIKGMFTGKNGKIDVDNISIVAKAISVGLGLAVLTQGVQAAIGLLGPVVTKVALIIGVAAASFEAGKTFGEIMAEHGLIPQDDTYWYETFKFTDFFTTLTADWDSTLSGIELMLTDFKNNPVIAGIGNALTLAFLGPIPYIEEFKKNFNHFVTDFVLKALGVEDGVDGMQKKFFELKDKIGEFCNNTLLTISDWADEAGITFDDLWKVVLLGYNGFVQDLGDGIYNFLNGIYHGIGDFVNDCIDLLNKMSFDIPEIELPNGKTVGGGTFGFSISNIDFGDLPKFFANGGFPQQGQLFVANESGPEMIGGWGNQTAVANNGQIVAGIEQGVATAVNMTLAPYLSQIANNTGVTANKDFSVKIGDRDIARANTRGQRSMGRQLIYTV